MPGEVISANGAGAELRLDAGPTVRAPESGGASPGERAHAVVRPEKLVSHSAAARPRGGPSVEGQVESSSTSVPPRRWSCDWGTARA